MPESTSNVEMAHHVHEMGHEGNTAGRWLGIAEAIVLAIVAVATAWSGYQAARWDAASAQQYSIQGRYTVLSQEKATLAGQDRLYDTVTFNGWVAAMVTNRQKLADFYVRRFRPEFLVAFKAWWRLDPVHNTKAPAGPTFMPDYHNANLRASDKLASLSSEAYNSAVDARERGDSYVEATVFLATVLFLMAVSQRFQVYGARVAVVVVAALLLIGSTGWLVTLPRR